nr:reverse transcriptase domain, reverse transcriptase zinc-binding domain protein [Tanacetum cinerariifolium]
MHNVTWIPVGYVDYHILGDFAAIGDAGNFAESHDFATTHGSNIVIDETTERGNSLERQRIHELDSEPISEPELQLPLSSVSLSEDIGSSTGDVGKSACSLYDRFTTEATSMNNVSPVDVYSLNGCVPDADVFSILQAPTVAKSSLQMDNINVLVVSFLGHCITQAKCSVLLYESHVAFVECMSIPPTEGHIQHTPKTIAAILETKTTAKREVYKEMTSTKEEETTKKPRHEKQIPPPSPTNIQDLFSWVDALHLSASKKSIVDSICGVVLRSLWSFRNESIFGSSMPKHSIIIYKIIDLSFRWYTSRNKLSSISWNNWIQNPLEDFSL